MGRRHVTPLLAGAAVVVAAGGAFIAVGVAELGKGDSALHNCWILGGLISVLLSLAMAVGAAVLHFRVGGRGGEAGVPLRTSTIFNSEIGEQAGTIISSADSVLERTRVERQTGTISHHPGLHLSDGAVPEEEAPEAGGRGT